MEWMLTVEELKTLVIRTRNGDLGAYGEIVRRFQDMAYGCAYAMVGDFHLAEDVAQEAFIDAYRKLPKLLDPAAFPGWFRRIVLTHCDRITRRKGIPTVALEAAAAKSADDLTPLEEMEKTQMQETVLAAIRALPEKQRTTTTLFYINGYSQSDIAEFLEVPVTTVKKRLYDARTRRKERMINMVEETLHQNAPDDRFSQQVIDELLGKPKPLEIEGNPVRIVWEKIHAALPEFEVVMGDETIERPLFKNKPMQEQMEDFYERMAFNLDDGTMLRTHTTITAINAIHGRTAPIHLLAPGRVFSNEGVPTGIGDAHGVRVFHMLDGICIDKQVDLEALRAICERMLNAIFDSAEIAWHQQESSMKYAESPMAAEVKIKGKSYPLSGCAMFKEEMLREFGHDPSEVSGGAFGIVLDLAAMITYDLNDIRQLWRPPYVPGQ